MRKLLILIQVGITLTLSSQTIFKNHYVNAQTIVNSYVFVEPELSYPTDSLVAYYPFSGNYNDESGNNAVLTPTGSPTLSQDRNGNNNSAYYFSTNNYFINTDNKITSPITNAFSISFWLKRNSSSNSAESIFDCLSSDGIQAIFLFSKFRIVVYDSDDASTLTYDSDTGITDTDNWYHIVITVEGGQSEGLKLYINNSLEATKGDLSSISNFVPDQSFWIGRTNAFNTYVFLDDIFIYNRVLTEDEISTLYNL